MESVETTTAEVKSLARQVLLTSSRLERVDFKRQEDGLRTVHAIQSILRNHVEGQPFEAADVEAVRKALNLRVERLRTERRRDVAEVQVLSPVTPQLRNVAELLVHYLDCFWREPLLLESKPIGVCQNGACQALFLKRRSDQLFCKPQCRERGWRHRKLEEDPTYYKRKAAEARAYKRKQAAKAKKKGRRG